MLNSKSPVLNAHGETRDTIVFVLNDFINDNLKLGIEYIGVIHGWSSYILKEEIHSLLKRNKNVKFLIIIMVMCIFTGLLTPIGDAPYTYLYKTMQGNTTQNISEHLPMTLIKNTEAMCVIVILLAILIFTKTKIKLSDLFMISGLIFSSNNIFTP